MVFNVIDILLLLLVLLSMLNGYRRGFILGVLDLASWVLSLLAGLRFYQPVARWLAVHVQSLPQINSRLRARRSKQYGYNSFSDDPTLTQSARP